VKAPNRTTLELKQGNRTFSHTESNSQSHHTGIETKQRYRIQYARLTPNRTTLELKPEKKKEAPAHQMTPNRTTLELKLQTNQPQSVTGIALPIAPHWN